jgi:hypothetical protein
VRTKAKPRLRAPLTRNSLQTWLSINKPGYKTFKQDKQTMGILHNGAVVAHGRNWREVAKQVGMSV